ncbi:MAG: ABC transporter permease [Candidatus Gastranaerophilales bacterium]|nr:ABC transporter permease [Candidatus Gastranaerophilales bacterium]
MSYKKVVQRELTRFNGLTWFISFIFPLILCLMICFIFAKASPTNLPIAVFNADNSVLSRTIVRDLNALPSCEVKYPVTNLEEGRQLLVEGKIYAFIVIPKNFQRDIYRQSQPKLAYYYNNQRILIGGIITKDVSALVQTLIIGIDAKIKSQKGIPFQEAVKQSNLINVVDHIRSNPYFNYLYLLSLTAFGHILQISMVMTSILAVGTEFKYGTTKEWLKEADGSINTALLGKFTPYIVLFTLLFNIILLIYFNFFHAPYVGNMLVGFLATVVFVTTCFALGFVIMSINGNFRFALSFAAFYVAIGFALAGVTFPVMAMPLVVKIYSMLMPLTYWVQIILDQSMRNIPFYYDIKYFLPYIILIFISLIGMWRLKILANDESRWFKS